MNQKLQLEQITKRKCFIKFASIKIIIISLLTISFVSATHAQNPLSPAADVNILTKNSFSATGGDIEGSIFNGGDFIINGYAQITGNNSGTGNTYKSMDGGNYKIVSHGNIIYTSGIFNVNGLMAEKHVKFGALNGGTTNISGSNVQIFNSGKGFQINNTQQASSFGGTSSFNFTNAFSTLQSTSTSFSNCTPNVNPTLGSNTFLTLGGSGRQLWNLNWSQLNSISTITFQNQPTATNPLIINVNAGGSSVWNVPTMAGIGRTNGAQYIIWNFYNSASLTIQGSGMVEGSILAPYTNITKNGYNNIEGQVIAASYIHNGGELHVAHFNANVSVCSLIILPIVLESFEVTKTFCDANLVWKTSSELNADRFELEVSTFNPTSNYDKFATIASTNSNAGKNYVYSFPMKAGITYYFRLKLIDKDGSFKYSDYRKMNCADKELINIAPNTVTDLFRISGMAKGRNTIKIYSTDGKLVKTQLVTNSYAEISIGYLSRGLYFVNVFNDNGSTYKERLIKY